MKRSCPCKTALLKTREHQCEPSAIAHAHPCPRQTIGQIKPRVLRAPFQLLPLVRQSVRTRRNDRLHPFESFKAPRQSFKNAATGVERWPGSKTSSSRLLKESPDTADPTPSRLPAFCSNLELPAKERVASQRATRPPATYGTKARHRRSSRPGRSQATDTMSVTFSVALGNRLKSIQLSTIISFPRINRQCSSSCALKIVLIRSALPTPRAALRACM